MTEPPQSSPYPIKKFKALLLLVKTILVFSVGFVLYIIYDMMFTTHSCFEEEKYGLRPYVTQGGFLSCDVMGVEPPAKIVVTQMDGKHFVSCKCGE